MSSPYMTGSLSLILLVLAVFGATTLNVPNSGSVAASTRWFDYVVFIMLENHDINYTYGVSNPGWNSMSSTCLGNCTYFTSLANSNGLAEGFTNDHVLAPSVGSYIAITSGFGSSSQFCNSEGPNSKDCPLLTNKNIVDSLESAHLTWKAYVEGYPQSSGCIIQNANAPYNYSVTHNPFVYYSDIFNNQTRCSHIVNANKTPVSQYHTGCSPTPLQNDDLLINDLNNVSRTPNFMFLIPNTIDDLHDCNDVSAGNAWMQEMIPQILGSTVFATRRAALFVTFDEPGCTFSGCPLPIPQLYAVWASNSLKPTTKAGFKSVQSYSLYSALSTIESNWSLACLVTGNDCGATPMSEFFT